MDIFLVVFFVMGVLLIAMSVGVILGRKPISGSCGGMSALGMEVACDVCKGDKSKCDKETNTGTEQQTVNAYDASR
jgi:hypothetical protein